MKKWVFFVLLCVEWLFGTSILKILFFHSCIYALLMIGINALLVWICGILICKKLFHKEFDTVAFMQNGVLTLNAVVLLVLYILSWMLYYAI